MKKSDVLLAAGVLSAAAIIFLIFNWNSKEGEFVSVFVGDEWYGMYKIKEDCIVEIEQEGLITNILVIDDGRAEMKEASCPDQVCVRHKAVEHTGESIVCLPNRVLVSVEGKSSSAADQLDAVAQ